MGEEGEDGKSAVTLLWNLRELKIALLGAYVGPGGHPAPKPEVPQWLALIPNKDVDNCLGLDEAQAPDTTSSPPSNAPASAKPAAANKPETRSEVDAAATADQSVHAGSADASAPEAQKRKHEEDEAEETPPTSRPRLDQPSSAPASVEPTSVPSSGNIATAT